jgi:hypothetical protein
MSDLQTLIHQGVYFVTRLKERQIMLHDAAYKERWQTGISPSRGERSGL